MTNYSIETKDNKKVEVQQREINSQDKEWFVKEFVRSFLFVYGNKVFYISKNDKDILLSQKDIKEKEKWLNETAEDEFTEYVANPKPGHKALAVFMDSKPVGIVLYRELKEENIFYLAQGFIIPEYQKKGIGSRLLEKLLEQISQDYDEFHILTRHQNDAAMCLYNLLGFAVGNAQIVEKYGYDPMRYISFVKNSPQKRKLFHAKKIEHTDLNAQNEKWFQAQMKDIYQSIYGTKSIIVQRSNGPVTLGVDDQAEKEEWINETINNCLNQFYVNRKPGFESLLFNYEEHPIACFLYEVNSDYIHITEAFVVEEYRCKGLFRLFINTISSLYKTNGIKSIKINVRHQNDAMMQCASKMGFYINADSPSIFHVSMQKSIENFEIRKISARGIQFMDCKSEDHNWLLINYVKHFLNVFNNKIFITKNEANENPLILNNEKLKKKFATDLANRYLNDLNENKIKVQIVWKNNEKIGAVYFKLDINNSSLLILDFFTVNDEISQNILSDFVKCYRNSSNTKVIKAVVNHQNEIFIQALVNNNFQMGKNLASNQPNEALYQKYFYLNLF